MVLVIRIVLLISVCFLFAQSQDCPECDSETTTVYESNGCKPRCVKGRCVTKYNCDEATQHRIANNQCIYDNVFYNPGDQIPIKLYDITGENMCNYECTTLFDTLYVVSIIDGTCEPRIGPFNPNDYLNLIKLLIPGLMYLRIAVAYDLTVPRIDLVGFEPDTLSNCEEALSCCRYGPDLFKVGTYFDSTDFNCTCKCPPLMSCKIINP